MAERAKEKKEWELLVVPWLLESRPLLRELEPEPRELELLRELEPEPRELLPLLLRELELLPRLLPRLLRPLLLREMESRLLHLVVSQEFFEARKNSVSYGETDVAYGRVMLIGSSGVGKTSLIRGLQHKLYNPYRSSTVVAKVQHLIPEGQHDAINRDWVGHKWCKVTEQDELEELSQLIAAVTTNDPKDDPGPSNVQVHKTPLTDELQQIMNSKFFEQAVKRAILINQGKIEKRLECLPFYHVWDCGGQPVFLEVLPAFLTSHTIFLPLFDASKSIHEKLQSVQYFKGKKQDGEVLNISSLELVEGWMSSVHGHLLKRDDKNVPLGYPRVLPVGTRGDHLKKEEKEEVLKELGQSFEGKAFHEILKEPLIIDNTTAGTDKEDPGYQRIRDEIFNFTTKELKKVTPVTWVLFRRLVQLIVSEKIMNTLSINEAKSIASVCKINEADVLSVLQFYHELGVVLCYPHIEGFQNTIIVNPKWFVECLGKIFALKGREEAKHEMKNEWKLLRDKGILVQPLYETVWSQYAEGITPEAIMKLLVSLQLAVEIHTNEFHRSGVKQFFVPAVLPYSTTSYQQPTSDVANRAAPLHITFMEQYVVPGYFIRLIAVMQDSPLCSLSFDHVFHDRVSFHFGDPQASFVTLVQTSKFIEVHFISLQENLSRANVQKNCQSLMKVLSKSCEEVEKCLRVSQGGVKPYERLRVVCEAVSCQSLPTHYLSSQPVGSQFSCEENRMRFRELTAIEIYWFTIMEDQIKSVRVKDVYDYLKKVSHRWNDIGRELGVSFDYRESLKMEGIMTSNNSKLEKVLYKWNQSQSTAVSWETIIKMLHTLDLNC